MLPLSLPSTPRNNPEGAVCPPPPDSLTPGFPPYCPSQEPIFPSALKLDTLGLDSQLLVFRGPRWPSPS